MHYANVHLLEKEQSLCPFKLLTGFPCPGCGITKSMVFFYKGEWLKSCAYHLFGPVIIVFAVFNVIVLIIEIVTQKDYFKNVYYNIQIAYVLGGTLILYHLIRTIDFVLNNNIDTILRQSVWK